MILNIFISGQTYYSVEWPTALRIINEIFGTVNANNDLAANVAHEEVTASFTLSSYRLNGIEALRRFDSYLHVAVNNQTGYGALKWLLPPGSTVSIDAAIAEHVWISNNSTPPDVDPHVVSEPDLSRYYDPQSTLPIAVVRAATEEFCRAGNGMRPSCIDWTPGDFSGRRLDVYYQKDSVVDCCDDPWCEISETSHPRH
ncbi:Imm1 family immunity protein [Streptomyces sp. NBC_00328]|uniref:Imm1 family immunity protein n=1 Tax=Streptomyces sp. NBC_00328 TaxID=2903646 RepID=UPI002E2D9072|nr:Imm1 family immunity protein [Streptomyces sp. NBC_00328]